MAILGLRVARRELKFRIEPIYVQITAVDLLPPSLKKATHLRRYLAVYNVTCSFILPQQIP